MPTIVSDFDGVMTDQTAEALRVRALVRERVQRAGGLGDAEVDALFATAEAALAENPYAHGWRAAGRITGFANEDLFIRQQGVSAHWDALADAGEEPFAGLRASLQADGLEGFVAAADRAFGQMSEEVKASAHKPLDPAARGAIETLLASAEVVIVSNSGTDRVVDILRAAGLTPGSGGLRVRGDARKFALAETPEVIDVGGYPIDVARPNYDRILREERPVAVIGDVFSFDLALPLHLARTEPSVFPEMTLVLRTREYTPAWIRELFAADALDGVRARTLDAIADLPATLVGTSG